MDEESTSPDNGGYPLLPSFFDSAFDVNDLPLRGQGLPGEHQAIITPSSFLQTEHDSGDTNFLSISKTNRTDSGLIRPSLTLMEALSNVHRPANTTDPDSQSGQSSFISGSLLAHGMNENVNPKESGVGGIMAKGGRSKLAHDPSDYGRHLEPMIVKKYQANVLEHDEDSTQYLIPIPATDSSRITSGHGAHGSPEKKPASPLAPPLSDDGTLNTPQHLDYQQYLNLDKYYHDSIDSSCHGPDECSTHAGRIRGSQTDMLGVSGFFGRKDTKFTSDETEILGPEFPRNSAYSLKAVEPLRIPGVVAHGAAEHELSLILPTPDELPPTPVSPTVSNQSDESPAIGTNRKTKPDNSRPGTSMGSEKTKDLTQSGSTERSTGSDTRLTRTVPINSGDDGFNSISNGSECARTTGSNRDGAQSPGDEILENAPGSAQRSDPLRAIQPAAKGDIRGAIAQATHNQYSLELPTQTENSSASYSSESAHLGPSTVPRSTLRDRKERDDTPGDSFDNNGNNGARCPGFREALSFRQTVQDLESHIGALKEEVRKTMEKSDAQAKCHSAIVHKLNYDHKRELFQQRRQALTILEERIDYYENRHQQHLQEAEEAGRTAAHLSESLEMEEMALVKNLQAELEGIANAMPIDHGWSRMIEVQEAGDWLEGNSREINQYHDGERDQIVTELQGSGGREDLCEATQGAEIGLTHVTVEDCLDWPLHIKRTVTEAEGKSKKDSEAKQVQTETHIRQLIMENSELNQRNNSLEHRVNDLEGDKSSLQRLVNAIEAKMRDLRHQVAEENGHIGVVERKTHSPREQLAQLENRRTALEKSKHDLETRIKATAMWEQAIRPVGSETTKLEATGTDKANEKLESSLPRLRSSGEKLSFATVQQQTSTTTLGHDLQTLFNTKLAISRLTKEQQSLKNDLSKAVVKYEVSRTYLTQSPHPTAEKEKKCNQSRQAKDPQSHRQTEDLLSESSPVKTLPQVHERRGRAPRKGEKEVRK